MTGILTVATCRYRFPLLAPRTSPRMSRTLTSSERVSDAADAYSCPADVFRSARRGKTREPKTVLKETKGKTKDPTELGLRQNE
eukprot:CAMPEP_0184661964 /NCGR_PEP_ID=MMETSP0308-20130426/40988_1 /TAXON_ID=38269 /ORGANISM="Gloeochaete witrockiana, Strain SAG 46.84" /LENGTH=83 /DNA_ID=CAMNT_0027103653 /DNA_START=450 /DNA_END=698 /DNA_ORIENTATION=+